MNLQLIVDYYLQQNEWNEEQPQIVSLYTKIAGNYRLIGDFKNAIEYSSKVYKLMKKLVGKEFQQTISALRNVGILRF